MIRHSNFRASKRRGLTLVELVVVLTILVALGSMVIPVMSSTGQRSSDTTTDATLVAVRDAMGQWWSDTKYVALPGTPASVATEAQRFQVRWLFENPVTGNSAAGFDPDTQIGWNGPYLIDQTGEYAVNVASGFTTTYGADGDPAAIDSWTGSPVVIQAIDTGTFWDVRIVSAGPDGEVDLDPSTLTENLTPATSGDDIYVALQLR